MAKNGFESRDLTTSAGPEGRKRGSGGAKTGKNKKIPVKERELTGILKKGKDVFIT